MAIRQVNPTGNTINTTGDYGSGLYLPKIKQEIFGALSGLDNDTANVNPAEFTYGVSQLETQTPDVNPQSIQALYGTSAMPVFQWVRTIQTGERKFDPNNQFDTDMLNEYNNISQQGLPEGYLSPEELQKQITQDLISGAGSMIGAGIGKAYAEPTLKGFDVITEGLKSTVGFDLPSDILNRDLTAGQFKLLKDNTGYAYNPALKDEETAKLFGLGNKFASIKDNRVNINPKGEAIYAYPKSDISGTGAGGQNLRQDDTASGQSLDKYTVTKDTGTTAGEQGFLERFKGDTAIYAGLGSGLTTFGIALAQNKDPETAAKQAVGVGVGTYLGTALGGPIGGFVGGTIGAGISGRVICNELRRQKLMTSQDVILDYEFTLKHLSPKHLKGYQTWAVYVVKMLRKGHMVNFWKHIAQHRANEIKYIMGKSNKPDYLGKLYRHILEPFSYMVGIFAKKQDISFLYKKGETNGT
jgi:hypothetical protein